MTKTDYSYKDIPKVTLHEHMEGTVTPKLATKLAKRHNTSLPDGFIMEEGTYDAEEFPNGRYSYDESEFLEFVNTYDVAADLVRTEEDYYDLTKEYLLRSAAQGSIYVEFIISPAHMASEPHDSGEEGKFYLSNKRYQRMLDAMKKAAEDAKAETGIETRYIATAVRHFGRTHTKEIAELVRDNPDPMVVGFGIAGDESHRDFHEFEDSLVGIVQKEAGLPLSLHAGEITGPESIRGALDLNSSRIGHGIKIIKDPALMEEVAQKGVMLEVCPTSNRILVRGMKGSLDNHPLRKLYEAGIRVSINPDDAGIFGTNTGKEHRIAKEHFGFARAELFDVTLCGIEDSFADEATKKALKEKTYSLMTEEDRKELAELAKEASNPHLKKRLEQRVQEVG